MITVYLNNYKIAFGMESNTLNDPSNKLNKYVTESFKGFFNLIMSETADVLLKLISLKNLNATVVYLFSLKFKIVQMAKNLYYKNDYAKIVAKLRQLGRNQIESRLKLIQEGSYIPNDLLTITLKSYGNNHFLYFII
jgi:cobalamin biosynthesis Co2+ chelatase CbiK